MRSRQYDSSSRAFTAKKGVTVGMGRTEKQGGSDLSGRTTRCEDARDGAWKITAHKWFL